MTGTVDLMYCRVVVNLLSRPLIAEFLPDRLMPGLRGSAAALLRVAARGLRWPGGTTYPEREAGDSGGGGNPRVRRGGATDSLL